MTISAAFLGQEETTIVDLGSRRRDLPPRPVPRRPDDNRAERISVRYSPAAGRLSEATFQGDAAWMMATATAKMWGYSAPAGRPVTIFFSVRFGDGVTLTGEMSVSRLKRPDLAAYCRTVEAFQRSFVPDLQDRAVVRGMYREFLKSYVIPTRSI